MLATFWKNAVDMKDLADEIAHGEKSRLLILTLHGHVDSHVHIHAVVLLTSYRS